MNNILTLTYSGVHEGIVKGHQEFEWVPRTEFKSDSRMRKVLYDCTIHFEAHLEVE